MRYLLGLTCSLLLMAGPALAQTARATDVTETLARQYLAATHWDAIYRNVYARQVKLALRFCVDQPCQPDLERAIDAAVDDAMAEYIQGMAHLLAQNIREDDLRASIAFAQSPSGKSILAAEEGMEEQLAMLGHDAVGAAYVGVSARFCPKHKDICFATGLLKAQPASPSK